MAFPIHRMRRLRATEGLRRMVRETHLSTDDLVMPLFVRPGQGIDAPIASMPGQSQLSIDRLLHRCGQIHELGVPAVLLFGLPESKDEVGSSAWDDNGIVQQATRAIKKSLPELVVIADVCFCEYTDHGHCGVLSGSGAGRTVDNDATLVNLARQSVSLARAGVDIIAPSDMMDGRVGAIRRGLDEAGLADTPIMSYAAKYASGFYGPFRDAAESAPAFGDRRSYQMDPANGDEALREVALDVEEGADIVMVKPALAYLDIIRRVKETFRLPTAAYHVSGEYSMIKAAAERGWLDERRIVMETLTAIKRAGADILITYYAPEAAAWIEE
ncbi:MAG: Delta-aminolevulinic acid dehydratase [Phycisphaerae bacterium]|nr:Delta-aminolevulinic acid dehydratase [Phycisphaerae bacterium]